MELFKKTLVAGLSVMLLTKEKAEEIVEELVEQGKISQQEAEEIIEELLNRTEEGSQEAKSRVKSGLDSFLDKTGLRRDTEQQDEINVLKDKLRILELEVEALKREVEDLKEEE